MTITLELVLRGATDEEDELAELYKLDSPAVLAIEVPLVEDEDLDLDPL